MKHCWDCKTPKPLDDFYNNARSKDGKQDRCKACCKAHAAAYYLRNKESILAKNKAWADNNPDKVAAIRQDWQARNPDKLLAYDRKWKAEHHDLMRERDRERYDPAKAKIKNEKSRREHPEMNAAAKKHWNQEHPEKVSQHNGDRRARLAGCVINDFTAAEWAFLKNLYGHTCAYCGIPSQRLTKEHVISLDEHGNNTLSNILPACKSCNSKKHATRFIIPLLLRCADGVARLPEAFVPQWRTPVPIVSPVPPSVPSVPSVASTQLSLL